MNVPIENLSQIEYCVAIVNPENHGIFALSEGDGIQLPKIAVSVTKRPVQQLQKAISDQWGFKTIILDLIYSDERGRPCVLAEAIFVPSHLHRDFFSLERLSGAGISVRERVALQDLFDNSSYLKPLSRLHWLDQARMWIQNFVSADAKSLNGEVYQLNAGGGFALAHFGTQEGRGYWLKAVGPPNTHEYALTLELARILPDFLPPIVASRKDWNAWVMEDFGASFRQELGVAPFEKAVHLMSSLQLQTTSIIDLLLAAGCADRRISMLLNQLDGMIEYLEETMTYQLSTKASRLGRGELHQLKSSLLGACSEMLDLQVPDALLHGDMNPGNILFNGERCVFIDWAEAFVGNPFLAFEGLATHLIVTRPGTTSAWIENLRQLYKREWQSVLSEKRLSRAFCLTPLIAIASDLLGRADWLHSSRRRNPRFQAYARCLARKMYSIVRERMATEALCL